MNLFKEQEQKESGDDFDAGFKLPETKSIMAELNNIYLEELRMEHREETEEAEKKGVAKRQRQGGVICCCGVPGCGIGPMVERS